MINTYANYMRLFLWGWSSPQSAVLAVSAQCNFCSITVVNTGGGGSGRTED